MSSKSTWAGAAAVLAASVMSFVPSAQANTFTLINNYTGGIDTYNNGAVIGPADVFGISKAVVSRPNPDKLEVVIYTAYAGQAGIDGTGYGALFLSPGNWTANPAPSCVGCLPYSSDVYVPGEWQYAFTMPETPSSNTGSGKLYNTNTGNVITSFVGPYTETYPIDPTSPWYFRQGQAVQFAPANALARSVGSGIWDVNSTAGTITFLIDDGGTLGNYFALAWAMTCANGVIQGQVNMTPVPAALPLFASGVGFLGFFGLRRRKRTMAQPILRRC